jgi:pimeloyl-ACP methyl ester carboxylesterase
VGEYVPINGHPTWVQTAGDGDPVVLLHGGFTNGDGLFEVFGGFATSHTLVAFDRRGHGRTADTDAPFHYRDMAGETIGVIEHIERGPADLIGFSDGGVIALIVALERPDLVRSLVLLGANYHYDGVIADPFDDLGPDSELVTWLQPAYAERSPDGADHFMAVIAKEVEMFTREPEMTPDDLARITVPALVLVGDDDAVVPAHTWSLYESLPAGQLAVIPGASHLVPYEKSDLVVQLVADFLRSGGVVETQMPIHRA